MRTGLDGAGPPPFTAPAVRPAMNCRDIAGIHQLQVEMQTHCLVYQRHLLVGQPGNGCAA